MPELHSTGAHFKLYYFKCIIMQCEGLQWKAGDKTESLDIPNEQTR